jgi:photosystem I protein
MTTQADQPPTSKVGAEVAKTSGKPPYTFRTLVSLILLAGNFLVAAIYFHIVNP